MRLVASLIVAVSALSAGPNAAPPALPITVLLDFERPYSSVSINALQHELHGILDGMPLKVDFRLKTELPQNPEFGDLVVFKLKGNCSMNALPVGALSDERGPLAMTYSVDGEVLPFGEIECDHVRDAIERSLGPGNPEAHQTAFGRALARVMAHEMYHMLTKSAKHTKNGVTRESLSGRELAQDRLTLDEKARVSMREAAQPDHIR